MLSRVALVALLVLLSGAAAIFAAGHFGVRLPWDVAAPTSSDPTAKTAAAPTTTETTTEAKTASDAAAPADGETAKTAAKSSTEPSAIEEATAALNPPPTAEAPPAGGVALDISRVSPDGPSVFAGRAEPESYVTVYEGNTAAGSVKADANGEWSLVTEHKFASTDPKLSFEASKTAPPPPEPPKTPRVAEASAADAPSARAASTVASDVMRKFEKLVEDAREEARLQREAATTTPPVEPTSPNPPPDREPAASDSVATAPAKVAAADPQPETPAATASSDTAPATAAEESSPAAVPLKAPEPETPAIAEADTSKPGETVIPVPIMFVYNKATLTPEGERAANLLLEYLMLKHLKVIELSGHADERGTHDYNMDLSRDRLETVSALLKQGGYEGDLKLTPKGKTEPYRGVDRSGFRGEALYQLDRRVELRVAR